MFDERMNLLRRDALMLASRLAATTHLHAHLGLHAAATHLGLHAHAHLGLHTTATHLHAHLLVLHAHLGLLHAHLHARHVHLDTHAHLGWLGTPIETLKPGIPIWTPMPIWGCWCMPCCMPIWGCTLMPIWGCCCMPC
eukprot:EC835470.1.p3 GENE.EC835470.1~~EC835470.1.p3  ORF type:complete len:138 (-),score=19.07 EC835470.1:87-500(-)